MVCADRASTYKEMEGGGLESGDMDRKKIWPFRGQPKGGCKVKFISRPGDRPLQNTQSQAMQGEKISQDNDEGKLADTEWVDQ